MRFEKGVGSEVSSMKDGARACTRDVPLSVAKHINLVSAQAQPGLNPGSDRPQSRPHQAHTSPVPHLVQFQKGARCGRRQALEDLGLGL